MISVQVYLFYGLRMVNRDKRGHFYGPVRGEILGPWPDKWRHSPRMSSLIKSNSWYIFNWYPKNPLIHHLYRVLLIILTSSLIPTLYLRYSLLSQTSRPKSKLSVNQNRTVKPNRTTQIPWCARYHTNYMISLLIPEFQTLDITPEVFDITYEPLNHMVLLKTHFNRSKSSDVPFTSVYSAAGENYGILWWQEARFLPFMAPQAKIFKILILKNLKSCLVLF